MSPLPLPSYERTGSGQPLLLVHGLGSARSIWAPLLPELARRFDVIAVDLPGHGATPPLPRTEPATPHRLARRVGALLDALGVEQPHVVGHSLGGWVSLELAADGRARSLTALAPAGLWLRPQLRRNPTVRTNRALSVLTRPALPLLLRSPAIRGLGFASASAYPSLLSYDAALAAAQAQADAHGYGAALDGTVGHRFDRAGDIPADVPVTVVWGDRDHILPARSSQEPSLAPAHARWVVLPRCGHCPQWDAPGQVLRLLAAAG